MEDLLMRRINKLTKVAIAYQKAKSGGIVGRAFTDWKCLRCEAEHTHPDTGVPFICDVCIGNIKNLYESGYFHELLTLEK